MRYVKVLFVVALLLSSCTTYLQEDVAVASITETEPQLVTSTIAPTPSIASSLTQQPTNTPAPTNTPIPTITPLSEIPRLFPYLSPLDFSENTLISSLLFGTNYWYFARDNRWSDRAIELFRQNKISMIRLGASSENLSHSKDGLEEFIRVCREIGAEPLVQVKLFDSSPEEAARVVRFANFDNEYNVRFWSIGNEPDIWQDLGKGEYSVADLNKDWREYALAMKAVDPSIILVGPDLGWKWQFDHPDNNWITPFIRENGDLLDVVSLHYYPSTSTGDVSIAQLLDTPNEFDRKIHSLFQNLKYVSDKEFPIAITEFNMTWDWNSSGQNSAKSYWAGLWTADMYGKLIDNHIYIGLFWSGYAGSLSLIERNGQPRATYYGQAAYRNFGSNKVNSLSSDEDISIYASQVPETGYIALVVVNKKDAQIVEDIYMEYGSGKISLDLSSPNVLELELPAYSISSLVLSDDLSIVSYELYSETEWRRKSPPVDMVKE